LVNEDAVFSDDGFSNIFLSKDLGASWQSVIAKPTNIGSYSPFFVGSIAATECSVYAQSRADGIYRSTDNGQNWKSIGGPHICYDTRYLTALNANIIFALDSFGSIWATFNSGGDSLSVGTNGSSSFAPKTLFS